MSKKKRKIRLNREQWKTDLKVYGIGTCIVVGFWCILTLTVITK